MAAGTGSPKNGFDLSVPDKYVSLDDARNLIVQELNNRDDSLFVLTPGVGKTHAALQAISKIGKDRIVIYGAFNRDLQNEAYAKICELAGHSDGFYLLQPREQTCLRSSELKDITSKGFSPSEILCTGCEYRNTVCEYYGQRREFGPGVYFVTLHMLRYLQDQIPTPDLIILDENLKAGLLLEDTLHGATNQIRLENCKWHRCSVDNAAPQYHAADIDETGRDRLAGDDHQRSQTDRIGHPGNDHH